MAIRGEQGRGGEDVNPFFPRHFTAPGGLTGGDQVGQLEADDFRGRLLETVHHLLAALSLGHHGDFQQKGVFVSGRSGHGDLGPR